MTKADLHVHTTHSDGMMTPKQVIDLAIKKGLQAIAITDHDVLTGVQAATQFTDRNVEVISGVEISTLYEGQEIHMLGFFVDVHQPELLQALKRQREVRHERNQMMIERLVELGVPITLEEVMERKQDHTIDKNVGRPHIAEVLIAKGIVQSMDEAFDKYLGKDGLAYLTPDRISPMEAVALIKQSRGVPVIAHPGLYQKDKVIPPLVEAGMEGIEVDHPDHTEEDRQKYRRFAEKYNLVMTAGSDFHGDRNGSMYHADLGTCTVPYIQVVKLKQRAGLL